MMCRRSVLARWSWWRPRATRWPAPRESAPGSLLFQCASYSSYARCSVLAKSSLGGAPCLCRRQTKCVSPILPVSQRLPNCQKSGRTKLMASVINEAFTGVRSVSQEWTAAQPTPKMLSLFNSLMPVSVQLQACGDVRYLCRRITQRPSRTVTSHGVCITDDAARSQKAKRDAACAGPALQDCDRLCEIGNFRCNYRRYRI